ncbi:DNA-binding transcriptional regulator, LysR family [Rhodoblastus acidophilus]|uniref:HTH-type transcriptional regulator CbbR n=1 Tax=Rhodoblastus acidophilus TaxID=1074 RepID=A0A212Q427_RHOAC|nr:LysR family transcriptional regulator [Rhodoblastus acidophilus]MCW2316570.1 DNA-binding transcriptional LysR family regulator [Rhodoblastus acidophilus]PPQ37178.1 LysR family transcriptional regulator [Rhodoblastus acidophilus]RAI16642.1 LysR family transcriptional regulator [Rhodoblastus acidophilus]SNB54050.1 DNA-binding transcriptional regulator, LysR family [Rhodoblastus acidophilus]
MPDFRGLTRRQLRAFAATVERGSVSGAAITMGVTPPAISTQLKLLEEMVGAPLFHRDGPHPFAPTEIGAELLGLAQDFERLAARAGERVDALIAGATGSVAFGVVSTGKYLAPYFVAAFNRAFPDIRVTLEIGNREEIIAGLERDEYDVAMMGRPPAHIRVETATLGDHPHVLIAPPGHRLQGDNQILAEDLVEERFLAREPGSGTRILMERFLARLGGGRPFNVVEMGTNETIKQSVMAGLGVAIISAHTCRMELKDGHLISLPVTGLPLVRQWFLLTRVDPAPSRAALKFRDFFIAKRAALWPKV